MLHIINSLFCSVLYVLFVWPHSKAGGNHALRGDLLPLVNHGVVGNAGQDLQCSNENRLLTVLLAVCQQVNQEIASADYLYLAVGADMGGFRTIGVAELHLEDNFYLSAVQRPGTDQHRLTPAGHKLMFPSEDMTESVFLDSSLTSCIQTLTTLAPNIERTEYAQA